MIKINSRGMNRTGIGKSTKSLFLLMSVVGVHICIGQNTFPSGGNVGIGTMSPTTKLHVKGDAPGNAVLFIEPNKWVTAGDYGELRFGDATHYMRGEYNNGTTLYDANKIQLLTGYVGIGTSAPSERLHVVGSNPHQELAIRVENTDTNADSFAPIQFKAGSSSNIWQTFTRNGDLFSGIANVADYFVIKSGGNIGIGTSKPDQKLTVNGIVHASEVRIDLGVPGPDYVFEKDYNLPSLDQVKKYIDVNKHLPEVPAAKEMENNSVNVGEMNMLLLKKVEELTLYIIEQEKRIKQLEEHSTNNHSK